MVAPNAMRTTRPPLIRRIVTARVPTRQAMTRAERQLQIPIRSTTLDLTAAWRLPRSPRDTLTARVGRRDLHCPAGESIAEDVAHVVPDLVRVEIVREDRLADVRLEDAVFDGADFQGNATGSGIAVEDLAVRSVFGDGVLRADAAAYRPEVNRFVALVCHDCATDSFRANDEREGGNSERIEKHDGQR